MLPVFEGGRKKTVAVDFGYVTNLMELKIVFSGGSSGMLCKVLKRVFN